MSLSLDQFPVPTQTSTADQTLLLKVKDVIAATSGNYSYLEIGSYRGGTLAPFLMDSACKDVFSVDDRGRVQPDERGISYDYTRITTQSMIDGLKNRGIDTRKLTTFDGSIHELRQKPIGPFDLAFIDGEHTDEGCFRDFIWVFPLMKADSIVLFHDSELIFKALKLVMLLLQKDGKPYSFFKGAGSGISLIAFGAYRDYGSFGPQEDEREFFARAETVRIREQFKNRARVRLSFKKLFRLRLPFSIEIGKPLIQPGD